MAVTERKRTPEEEAEAERDFQEFQEAVREFREREQLKEEEAERSFRGFRKAAGLDVSDPIEQFGAGIMDIPRLLTPEGTFSPSNVPEPETAIQRGARFAGETLVAAPIIGAAAALVPAAAAATAATGAAMKGLKFLKNVIHGMGRTFARAPVTTVATEAAIAVPAGITGFIAGEKFPDSKAAVLVGDLVGGSAAVMLPSVLFSGGKFLGKTAISSVDKILESIPLVRSLYITPREIVKEIFTGGAEGFRDFTSDQAKVKAGARLSRALGEGEKTLVLEKDVLPGLTLPQQSGKKGLLSLERSIIEESDKSVLQSDDQISRMIDLINTELVDIAPTSGQAGQTFEVAQTYFRELLNTRVRQAALEANKKLENLAPGASRESVNIQSKKIMDSAFDDGIKQEAELYRKIPQKSPRPTANVSKELKSIVEDTPKAQMGDIPATISKIIKGLGKVKKAPAILDLSGVPFPPSSPPVPPVSTVKELRGVQVALGRIARNAIKTTNNKQNRNKARISNLLIKAATKDIRDISLVENPLPGEQAIVDVAVNFSADLNTLFRQGTVGDILGFVGKTPDSISIENALTSGPRGRQAFDDIVNSLDGLKPDKPRSPEFIKSAEDFVLNRFFQDSAVVKNGTLNPIAARTFLRRNEELLKRLPEIKSRITQAIDSQDLSSLRERQRGSFDPKKSKATLFIQEDTVKAFNNVINSPNPSREMQKLINQAGRDKTGDATEGLKGSFIEFITNKSNTRFDAEGKPILSGFQLKRLLNDSKVNQVVKRLFTPGERSRLKTITNTAFLIEKAMRAKPSKEGVLGDAVSRLSRQIGRGLGGIVGRRMGTGTLQVPQYMAEGFSNLIKAGVANPAERFVIESVLDKKLFDEILTSKIEPVPDKVKKRFGAWVATVLANLPEESEESEE